MPDAPALDRKHRVALLALAEKPHFAVRRKFVLKGWARRGRSMVSKQAVETLFRAGLVTVGTVEGSAACVLTPAGAALANQLSGRKRVAVRAAEPTAQAELWFQK